MFLILLNEFELHLIFSSQKRGQAILRTVTHTVQWFFSSIDLNVHNLSDRIVSSLIFKVPYKNGTFIIKHLTQNRLIDFKFQRNSR